MFELKKINFLLLLNKLHSFIVLISNNNEGSKLYMFAYFLGKYIYLKLDFLLIRNMFHDDYISFLKMYKRIF